MSAFSLLPEGINGAILQMVNHRDLDRCIVPSWLYL